MASGFLTRLAREKAKKIDEEYGAAAYGGSATLRTPGSSAGSTTLSATGATNGGGNGAPATKASNFLTRLATQRAEKIDREYGSDAYGGSRWTALDKESGFNSWIDNLNRFSKRMSDDYSSREGQYQSAEALGKYRNDTLADIGAMQNRANIYRNYFRQNRELYGDDMVDRILSALDEGDSYLEGLREGLGSEYDFWAQFADEEDYNTYQRGKEYAALAEAEDFAEKSRYVSTYQPGTEKFNAWSGTYSNSGFGDIDYDYINRNETARDRQMLSDIQSNASLLGLDNSERGEMTDDEIAIFNYIYATQSPEAAYAYIDYLTADLNYRERAKAEEEWAAYANEHPIGSSVFSVLESPLKGLSYLGQFADYTADGEIDQNAGYNKFSYLNSAIRNEVTGIVEEKWGGVGSFAYQTGMSMGDFLFNTAITGGNSALTLGIMGSGAAADTTIAAKDRGLSDGQAFALGTIAGAAEIITEKFSLDALLKGKWEKGALQYVLKNAFTEGSEEVGSDFINLFADILISKDKSEWQMSIDAYQEDGMSEDEAFWHAVTDQAQTMGLDFLGGAVSGGVMSGAAIGINAGANAYTARQTGAEFQAMGDDVVQAVIQEGLASDPTTRSYQLAQQLQQKLDAGETITNAELGRLYQANVQAVDAEENSEDLLRRAAEELEQKGRVTNSTALDILDSPSARAALAAEANLSITEDMSKAAQRRAVKSAVAQFASRESGVSSRTGETTTPSGAETAQRATQSETGAQQQATPRGVNMAQQAHNIQSMNRAAQALGQQGARVAQDFYDGTGDATAYYGAFSAYYQAGVTGMDMDKVQSAYTGALNEAQRQAAYLAGQNDAAASLTAERNQVQYATVYGEEAGLIQNDHTATLPQAQAVYLNNLGKALGTKIEMTAADRGVDGYISGDGIIHISVNAQNPALVVASHEITHRLQSLAPAEYRQYRDYANRKIAEQVGRNAVEEIRERYARNRVNLSTEEAMDEVAAEFTEAMVKDGKLFRQLAEDNRSVARKVLDAVKDFIRRVKSAFRGNTRAQNSAAMEQYGVDMKTLEEAARLWQNAYDAAVRQAGTLQGQRGDGTMGETRYSVREGSKDERETENGGGLQESGRGKRRQGLERAADGANRGVRGEFSGSSGRYGGVNPSFGATPVRSWAKGHLAEPAEGSVAYEEQQTAVEYGVPSFVVSDEVWDRNKGGAPAFAAGGQIYFRETLPEQNRGMFAPHELTHVMRQVGYEPYLEFVARTPEMLNMSNGMTRVLLDHVARHQRATIDTADETRLYDEFNATMYGHIATGKTELFTDGPGTAVFHDFAAYSRELTELHDRFKRENGGGNRFSMKSPVEETQDLLALHNLTERNLRDALALGGLPMPSIAVVQAEQGHSKYGPISLVFSKDTIDPQARSTNRVYGGDAYTPTAPTVDRIVNEEVRSRVSSEIQNLAQTVADGMFSGEASAVLRFDDGYTNQTMDDLLDDLARNDGVRAAYLADKGQNLEPVMREKANQYDTYGNEALQSLANIVGPQELAAMYARVEAGEGLTEADTEAVRAAIRGALEQRSTGLSSTPEQRARRIELRLSKLTAERMAEFVRNAQWLYEDGMPSTEQEVDRYATKDALRDMTDEGAVRAWLSSKLDGLLGEAGIYNGKERFTPSGRRKGFSALHVPYTLENIVKAMTSQQAERGEATWGISAKTLQSVATPSYRNIREIKADSGRLGAVDGDTYEARVRAVDNAIWDVIGKVKKTNKAHSDNSFMESDIIGEVMLEAAKGKKTVDAIMRTFSKEDYKISSQTAQDIQAVYKAAAELPTEYFEAKPRRAVGFEEVLAAVVPDDMDSGLRSQAEQAGMRLLEYKSGDDADRLAKVNSVEGARFSIKEDSQGRTLTAAQQEFFRDSKVTDAEGRLLVLYHGTTTYGEITRFRRGRSGWLGPGIYLAGRQADAQRYADAMGEGNGQVYELYANVTNPLVVAEGNPVPEILRAAYGRDSIYTTRSAKQGNDTRIITPADIKKLQGKGYDGIQWNFGGNTEVSVFSAEQIKRVDNQTPTEDPDIRYSLRERSTMRAADIRALQEENDLLREQMRDYKDILRQNGTLRESRDYWRGQTQRTRRVTTDKKAVQQAARDLIRSYGADIETEEIAGDLQNLYDYLASGYDGKDELTYTEARRRAEAIAQRLVESAVAVDDEMYRQYSDLREYLRTTRLVLSEEDSHNITDYGDFRKRNMGRLRLAKGGTNIDMVYEELSDLWPEFFDAQRETHPADQLTHIAEVLDGINDVTAYNPFSQYTEQAVSGAANEIMERFFDLPQTRATFADRQAMRLQETKARDRQRLEREREQNRARIAELRQQNRQRVKEAIQGERMAAGREMARLKRQYADRTAAGRERRNAAELRRKITRHVSALSQRLLRPTDKHHIPESLRGPVAAMLEAINQESQYTIDPETGKRRRGLEGLPTKRTEAFRALKEQYAKIAAEGGDMVIDPALLGNDAEGIQGSFDAVLTMRDTPLADMSAAQLETVWCVVKTVEHSVRTAGKVLSQSKYERTVDWAAAIDRDTATRRPRRTLTKDGILQSLVNPYTFFSRYGEAGHAIYRTLRNAQDQQQLMVNRVAEEVRKIVDPKTVKSLEESVHTFTTERGDTVTLSTAQVMELYELMKRKQAQDHLHKGGIVQPEIRSAKIRRGTDAILLTAGDLATITGTLTDKQVEIANALQGLAAGLLADYGNRASMAAYGYKKFTGTDYWPINSAREGIHSTVEKGGNNTRAIKNIGLAKTTMPHASNPLDLAGIFSAFSSHAADMTDYAAWLCTMEDLNRLYNIKFRDGEGNLTGRTIKGLLDRVGGSGAQKYWDNLMEDIQNGIATPNDDPMTRMATRGIGSFKGAAVGANLRVVIQQPTAFFRAGAVLSPADLSRGLARGVTRGSGWAKALKYSPIAMRKDMGGFDISNPMQMNEILFDSRTRVRKLNDALSAPAGMADAITWGRLWNACEWATAREHKELERGSEAFYQAVNDLFTEVIDQTQVVDGVLQRSNIMRSSNAVAQQATSFMGEPIMSLNLLMRSYDQVRYEQDARKRGRAIKVFGRAATALVVTNVINALAQSIIDAMRDDDEDKKYRERFLSAFTGLTGEEESAWDKAVAAVFNGNVGSSLNPLEQVPFVKDVYSIAQGYDVSRTDMEVFSDLVRAVQTMMQSAGGDGKKTRSYAAKELLAAGAKVFGIPAGNLARDVWGLARSIVVETDNIPLQYEMEKAIYNITNDANKGRYYDILFRALAQGDMTSYQHIRSDLMNEMGLDGATIDSAMRSRYNKAVEADPGFTLSQQARDLIGSRDQYAPAEEKEETFGADDLGTDAYDAYSSQRAADYREMEDSLLRDPIFQGMSDEAKDKVLTAAYNLADKSALEDHSGGQYAMDTKWMLLADDAEDMGIEPWEYVLFHVAYNMAESSKDENGDTIKGEAKSDHVRSWLEEYPGITEEQREFLWGTVYQSEW